MPSLRITHVDIVLGVLEVVDIRGIVLHATSRPCDEMGKLTREVDVRGLLHVEEGDLVEHRGEPLTLLFPVHTQSPYRVVQRFLSQRHLRGECLFGEVHQRTADLEVLRELIFPVDTHHRLTLHAVVGVRLQRHVHVRTGIDDALVEDGHLTRRVIHTIVSTLRQRHTTCRHHHRSWRHVIGIEGDHTARRTLILSRHDVLILLRNLFGGGLRGVVELTEHVFLGRHGIHTGTPQLFPQITAERLRRGQEHTSVAHGVAIHEVEVAVRVGFVVLVQVVSTQQSYQRTVLHLRLRDIVEIHAYGVALELNIEAELGPLHRRGEVIHVFHHQVPVTLLRMVRGVLQRPHKERLRGIRQVTGKLTHLIGHTAIGELIGDCQHLIRLQSSPQRHITQGFVHGIFRTRQQTGTRQHLEVAPCDETRNPGEHIVGLVDVTGLLILTGQRGILRIGTVARHWQSRRRPDGIAYLRITQIGQCHDVTGVGSHSRLIRHPDLHTVDLDTRQEVGQVRHRIVVMLTEVMCQEEVTVFLVVGSIKLKGRGLRTAFRRDTLRR